MLQQFKRGDCLVTIQERRLLGNNTRMEIASQQHSPASGLLLLSDTSLFAVASSGRLLCFLRCMMIVRAGDCRALDYYWLSRSHCCCWRCTDSAPTLAVVSTLDIDKAPRALDAHNPAPVSAFGSNSPVHSSQREACHQKQIPRRHKSSK